MNKKRTNFIVTILNVVAIVSIYILYFSTDYLLSSMMSGGGASKSLYDNFILETLLNNVQIIIALINGGVGIINIVCAIQNKDNKKLCFWQMVFGIYEIWSGIVIGFFAENEYVLLGGPIIISAIAIIMAIINCIKIKKNKPKLIQVVSYIAVIIIAILDTIGIIEAYWNVIAIIMQFVYIHFQEDNIEESKQRKIINIVLYYVLQSTLVFGFLIMVVSSLIITKVNGNKIKNELEKLYSQISTLKDSTDEEICVPVENQYKYGFINEKGIEKISCEYDRVSFFNEIEINNNKYFIAFAMKNNNYYIISKGNDELTIDSSLTKYIQRMYDYFDGEMIKKMNKDGEYRRAYIQSFQFIFQNINLYNETKLTQQTMETNKNKNVISLTENDSSYSYKSNNYSMLIEPMENDEKKYKVTIKKNNGETNSSIVYLPGIREYWRETTLDTYSNGYIALVNEDNTLNGWYDLNGNQTLIPNNYEVTDIIDNKAILKVSDTDERVALDANTKYEPNYIIMDMNGKILLQTTAFSACDNLFLVKKNNKKMVLMDKDLKDISNEYDKIIANMSVDISQNFCSYY